MDDPWDQIRQPSVTKPPIGPGVFMATGHSFRVEVQHVGPGEVYIKHGSDTNSAPRYTPETLRRLARFYNELADQIQSRAVA